MKIQLREQMFSDKEQLFLDDGELKAYLFRYDSGVCGVKLENSKGYIVVLPYQGQMVWDAVFCGRSLKMKNACRIPKFRKEFRDTYGCYVMHCGLLRMGCPSEKDTHPHHGELPYVTYDEAAIVSGEDEKGRYLAVTGLYEYYKVFADHYAARPMTKLYAGSSLIDIRLEVENMGSAPMDLMYQCHINNAAEAGAKIYQTLPWDEEHMSARLSIPQYSEVNPKFLELLDRVREDVSVTRVIGKDDVYDPEIVTFLRSPVKDENGFVHYLYQHPDGSADYTTYDANVLNCAVRWIVYHRDWQAMGMVLPGTAEPEGYLAEKEKGNVRSLPGGETFVSEITAGYLPPEEAEQKKELIQRIMGE